MKLENLKLKNFRNYQDVNINFSNGVNVFIGKNAQGKTNLLESIFFAAIGKSFKACKDKEVINWDRDNAVVEMTVKKSYRDVNILISISSTHKKVVKINDLPIRRLGELIGQVNVVFFSPQELKLVRESPAERRKFMDIDISQNNKRYFYQLSRYDKILQNRNKLLKDCKSLGALKETVDIWDRALASSAKIIAFERQKFIEQILPYSKAAHAFISGGTEDLRFCYNCGCGVALDDKFEENFLKTLNKNLEKDFKLGYTSVGVHRDDIDIYLNDVEVKNFGSQGQQRTVALAMKLAELENMKNINGEYPILLLDDVFSELDADRQARLLKFVDRAQTFITCTDEKKIDGKLFKIVNGKIEN